MPVMKDSLQKEVKMLRACGAKAKGASDGFWFWFTKVEDEVVLVMRPRSRDPEGAKMKGAVAKARQAVKKATRKAPRRFVTGEAYFEDGGFRFYGNKSFPGFKDVIREFAKENKLKFLVGSRLYGARREDVDLEDEGTDLDDGSEFEDLDVLSTLPDDDPDFDVEAFLKAEMGDVEAVSARADELIMDPADLMATPGELKDQIRRLSEKAVIAEEAVEDLDEEIARLRAIKVRSSVQQEELEEALADRAQAMRQRDALLGQAAFLDAALPVEGQPAPEHISLHKLSRAQRKQRVAQLQEQQQALEEERLQREKEHAMVEQLHTEHCRSLDAQLGELRQKLAEKGIQSAAIEQLLITSADRGRPLRDKAQAEMELAEKKAAYAQLMAEDLSDKTPRQAHALLKKKLQLSEEMEELRAYIKNRGSMVEMYDIERNRFLDGKLEQRLAGELAEAGLIDDPDVQAALQAASRLRELRELRREAQGMHDNNERRLDEVKTEQARSEQFEVVRSRAGKLSDKLDEAFKKNPALRKLNPEKPSDLKQLRAELGDRMVFKLLNKRRQLWAEREKLAQLGARFDEQKALFKGMPDAWLPLQLRESEKLFVEVSDFLAEETGMTMPTKTEVRAERAGKRLSSSGGGNQMLDGLDQDLSPKQQALVMKFSSQLVSIASPLASATGASDVFSSITDGLTNDINEAFTAFAGELISPSALQAIASLGSAGHQVSVVVGGTPGAVDRLKAASSTLRDLYHRLADTEHGQVADGALAGLETAKEALGLARKISAAPRAMQSIGPDKPEQAGSLARAVEADGKTLAQHLAEVEGFIAQHKHLLGEVGGEVKELNGLDPVEQMMMMEELTQSLVELAQSGVELTAGLVTGILGNIPGLGIAVNAMAFIGQIRAFAENMSRSLVNSQLHEEASDELSVMEPTLDMIQDRDKRLAARKATEAAVSVLRIAADACTLSGVGAVATPALKGIAEGLNAIKIVGTQIDELTTAQTAKDELKRAHDGDALARKEIFRDDPRYAIGAIAVMAKKDPADDFAVRCLESFGISPEMIRKSSASVIRRYLKMKLQIDDDPATWDDVAELTVHSIQKIGEGTAFMVSVSAKIQLTVANQFVEDSPSAWPDALDQIYAAAQELGTHTGIVKEYRLANARLWDSLAANEGMDDRAMLRFKALRADLERREGDIADLRRQLLGVSRQLCEMQAKMQKGPTSFGAQFVFGLEAQIALIRKTIMDPEQAMSHGMGTWMQERVDQIKLSIATLNRIADRMAA